MSENAFYAAFFFPSAAAVLVFFMKYTSSVLQARVRLGQDEAYRAVASRAAEAEAETAASLASFGTRLNDIKLQLGEITRILQTVE